MIVPIALAAVLALVGFHFGRPKRKAAVVSGAGVPPMLAYRRQPAPPNINARMHLSAILAKGGQPSMQLLQRAWCEAHQVGDLMTTSAIEQYIVNQAPPEPQVVAGSELAQAEAPEAAEGEGAESWGEPVAAQVTTEHLATKPAPATPAPEEQVMYPSGWDKFCAALKTRDEGYRSDNYLGAYEHNRRRLRQLGIDESGLTDERAQHRAFCRDMNNYRDNCTKLFAEWTGKAIDINGQVHSITPSGILGLLKAAGPRGAEGWLRNPADRTAFPTTTEVFTRCNGCF